MNGRKLEERWGQSLKLGGTRTETVLCRVDESGFDLAIICATSNLRIETERGKKIKLP